MNIYQFYPENINSRKVVDYQYVEPEIQLHQTYQNSNSPVLFNQRRAKVQKEFEDLKPSVDLNEIVLDSTQQQLDALENFLQDEECAESQDDSLEDKDSFDKQINHQRNI